MLGLKEERGKGMNFEGNRYIEDDVKGEGRSRKRRKG
jgi:hypothetical protein